MKPSCASLPKTILTRMPILVHRLREATSSSVAPSASSIKLNLIRTARAVMVYNRRYPLRIQASSNRLKVVKLNNLHRAPTSNSGRVMAKPITRKRTVKILAFPHLKVIMARQGTK